MFELKDRIFKESEGKGRLIVYKSYRTSPCYYYHNPRGNKECTRGEDCSFVHMPEFKG